jgi:ABC-type transport system involved in multi-copper enzyme maturation permease subunit
MNVLVVVALAREVFREALASKVIWMALILTGLVVLAMMFALDLEVVDGALAMTRLMGDSVSATVMPVDVALRPVLQVVVGWVFYGGILAGIVATCEIVPRLLSAGRVERLLSLPIRRAELVAGTYIGVVTLSALLAFTVVGSCCGVLFVKGRFFVAAPLWAALASVVAFLPVYTVVMAVGALFRSAALAAMAGGLVFVLGIGRNSMHDAASYIRSPFWRTLFEACLSPLPNIGQMGSLATGMVGGETVVLAVVMPALGAAALFCIAGVVATTLVLESKDF